MNIDVPSAILASSFGLGLSGIAAALINFGENRADKKNLHEKIDSNKKSIEDKVSYNFYLIKDELAAHEARDDSRHKELIERIGNAEEHILEVIKKG